MIAVPQFGPSVLASFLLAAVSLCACDSVPLSVACAEESSRTRAEPELLHELINRLMARPGDDLFGVCSDSPFLRRSSLDLIGMPPRADEVREFLQNSAADRRTVWIDRLLESPQFDRHLAAVLDVMLMERRPGVHVTHDEWLAWLLQSVREDKPWNVLVREILMADGDDPDNRPPAAFYLNRSAEPHVITRDVGRMFFGRDLQCAQCHDSPLVSDFLQADYQGLLAFTAPGYEVRRKHGENEVSVFAERAGSDVLFESVFNRGTEHRTGPRLPGMAALSEPFVLPGDEYSVAPADGVRSVPVFSRRIHLAEMATDGSNQQFNVNIVNRLWALMMGRGLVHPLDMIHPDNPSVHPELLDELAQQFASDGFRIRSFLRELALTDVYQRPFDLPAEPVAAAACDQDRLDLLEQSLAELEQARRSAVARYEAADAAFAAAAAARLPVSIELDKERSAYAELRKKAEDARSASEAAAAAFQSGSAAVTALEESIQSLNTAAQLLSGDMDLARLAADLNARLHQHSAQLPVLKTAAEEKQQASNTAVADLLPAEASTRDVAARLQPLSQFCHQAEQPLTAARAEMQRLVIRETSIRDDVRRAKLAAGLPELQAELQVADQVLAAASDDYVRRQLDLEQCVLTQQDHNDAVARLEQFVEAAMINVSTAEQTLQMRMTVRDSLTDLRASIQAAQELLKGDESILSIAVLADSRLAAATTDMQQGQLKLQFAQIEQESDKRQLEAGRLAVVAAAADLRRAEQEKLLAVAGREQAEQMVESLRRRQNELAEQLAAEWTGQFRLSVLKPLTPEQLCWTIFRVTTVYDRYAAAEQSEIEKSAAEQSVPAPDGAGSRQRAAEIEQRTYEKLKGYLPTYVQFYGGGAGQPQGDFYASPDQALFASNAGAINSWVVPGGGNAAERIVQTEDTRLAAEELYLGILTRLPDDQEIKEVSEFLRGRADRGQAAQELVWGLLNSAEFRFNH